MLTLFGAVANVSKGPSAFILSDDRTGVGKIPRRIDFNIDWENVNVNTLRFVGRLLRTVGKFLQDCTVSDTTRQFSMC
jgi:orotate phosphoribosyltransferase-like protein